MAAYQPCCVAGFGCAGHKIPIYVYYYEFYHKPKAKSIYATSGIGAIPNRRAVDACPYGVAAGFSFNKKELRPLQSRSSLENTSILIVSYPLSIQEPISYIVAILFCKLLICMCSLCSGKCYRCIVRSCSKFCQLRHCLIQRHIIKQQ